MGGDIISCWVQVAGYRLQGVGVSFKSGFTASDLILIRRADRYACRYASLALAIWLPGALYFLRISKFKSSDSIIYSLQPTVLPAGRQVCFL